MSDDTIVAIATPLGEGGLGVVRLSGLKALPIASIVFSNTALLSAPSHTLHHGWILEKRRPVDEAVAAVFRGPRSYTGDDVVEFSCHGSPQVLTRLVELCQTEGARLAGPGEFTQRAFLNGKLDLVQAEAVADLIRATSSAARIAAAAQLKGELSKRIKTVRQTLVDLLAHVEANLDFVEEDIPGLERETLKRAVAAVIADLNQLLATSLKGRYVRDGIRVALIGRPNVGKSSLFNALLAQDRAIVSDLPGTTRDTLEERLQWNGFAVVLTDTAGLRETPDAVEREGAERARRASGAADVTLLVLDATLPLAGDDTVASRELRGRPAIAVLNKSDQKAVVSAQDVRQRFGIDAVVRTSAVNASGLDDLKRAVLGALEANRPETEAPGIITNLRHVGHLERTQERLEAVRAALLANVTEEAVAIDLRDAVRELSAITGESVTSDVLTAIFSRFCIGK